MKLSLAPVFFLITITANAQKLKMIRGHCGLYYTSIDGLIKQKQNEISFYNFQPAQTVASIGAQCSHWEAAYAAVTENVQFYLEDIDTTYFNERQSGFSWHYYDSLRGKPMTSGYHLILGDTLKTNLPEKMFDKVLIINSFHEFTYQKEMLKDISQKLKPGGLLYIDETLARRSGELHGVCHKRIYLDEELKAILLQNGYKYVDGLELNFRKSKPMRKIFAFEWVGIKNIN
jgi:SAM-dependent methyltransferase